MRPAVFDRDILSFDKAGVLQPLPESLEIEGDGGVLGEAGAEDADERHCLLLGPGGKRPGKGAAGTPATDSEHQLSPLHHQAVQPPSASSEEPVTKAAAGEA